MNLRTDIDTMKATIADTKVEIQDLKIENQTVKDVAEQKGKDVERFRAAVNEASEENNLLSSTRRRIEAEVNDSYFKLLKLIVGCGKRRKEKESSFDQGCQ